MSTPETGTPLGAALSALWWLWANICGLLALVHVAQLLLDAYHRRRYSAPPIPPRPASFPGGRRPPPPPSAP